jgi:hypothetical protein
MHYQFQVFFRDAQHDLRLWPTVSRRVRINAAQLAEAAHVVGEVLHPNLGLGPHQTDGAHQGAAHVVSTT